MSPVFGGHTWVNTVHENCGLAHSRVFKRCWRAAHHIEVALCTCLIASSVQRAVVASEGLPGPVQVVGHQVDKVHLPG